LIELDAEGLIEDRESTRSKFDLRLVPGQAANGDIEDRDPGLDTVPARELEGEHGRADEDDEARGGDGEYGEDGGPFHPGE